jgi:D-psicose/D-tagatose/L-ribulose 3-epimerase
MFSVSNIAWKSDNDEEALELISSFGIRYIEAAPARLWPRTIETPTADVRSKTRELLLRRLKISGFQAVLFGKPDLMMFSEESRPRLLEYMKGLIDLCCLSGASYMVFGAPRNRWVPDGLGKKTAFDLALRFFRDIGMHAMGRNVAVGIEANPAQYNCNFGTSIDEVVALVRAIQSPAIGWHVDTGEMAMNAEDLPRTILENANLITAVHVSEPGLQHFDQPWIGHKSVADALRRINYKGFVSLEMLHSGEGLKQLKTAIHFMLEVYS